MYENILAHIRYGWQMVAIWININKSQRKWTGTMLLYHRLQLKDENKEGDGEGEGDGSCGEMYI